jgi:hypothetical protein
MIAACPPLSPEEQVRLQALRGLDIARLAPEAAEKRRAFINTRAAELSTRAGVPIPQAKKIVLQQCEGVLLPDIVLPFDDRNLAGATVGDVLADPDRFEGETLADPIEGPGYGRCKAKILLRPDGSPWIHSFAHGNAVYQLQQKPEPQTTADRLKALASAVTVDRDRLIATRTVAAALIRCNSIPAILALSLVEGWNEKHCLPPLPREQIISIVNALAGRQAARMERHYGR